MTATSLPTWRSSCCANHAAALCSPRWTHRQPCCHLYKRTRPECSLAAGSSPRLEAIRWMWRRWGTVRSICWPGASRAAVPASSTRTWVEWDRWDPTIVRQELEHLNPSAIVLTFGTDAGFLDNIDVAAYGKNLAQGCANCMRRRRRPRCWCWDHPMPIDAVQGTAQSRRLRQFRMDRPPNLDPIRQTEACRGSARERIFLRTGRRRWVARAASALGADEDHPWLRRIASICSRPDTARQPRHSSARS